MQHVAISNILREHFEKKKTFLGKIFLVENEF